MSELPGFELSVAEGKHRLLARVRGPLDDAHMRGLLGRLQPFCRSTGRLVLDLRGATYLDSDGVRALLLLQRDLEAASGELRLVVEPHSSVERTLALLRLSERFMTSERAADVWRRKRRVQVPAVKVIPGSGDTAPAPQ